MNTKKLPNRLIMYFIGLFILSLGISVSVKSDLGVSPVSSIPYTMTKVFGLEMGKATMIFHAFLVLLQIIILRQNFKLINLLQIAVGIVFGYFTTFSNYLFSFLPTPESMAIRLLLIPLSIFLIGLGIFLYVSADIIPIANEGMTRVISDVTHLQPGKVKIIYDITLVSVSLTACLIVIHSPGSVGFGTLISALLVGTVLCFNTKHLSEARDSIFRLK